jgi:hypothetical protein
MGHRALLERFRAMFLSTRQARIQMACQAFVLAASVLVAVTFGSTSILLGAVASMVPMLYATYAVNCYVVGGCHLLSWFSTSVTVLWTLAFVVRLYLATRRRSA